MNSALQVRSRLHGAVAVIDLIGDVNSDGNESIQEAFDSAISTGDAAVVFNLDQADYINTSGISVLITTAIRAREAGVNMAVAGASKHYRKVFELVQFSQFVPLFDTESDAVDALA